LQRTDASKQLREFEWLHKVVIRAAVQALELVIDASAGGQHDDADPAGLTDGFQQVPAVDTREVHVQEDQRIDISVEQVQSIYTVVHDIYDIPAFG
jgi:hypothetical protein